MFHAVFENNKYYAFVWCGVLFMSSKPGFLIMFTYSLFGLNFTSLISQLLKDVSKYSK